MCMLVVTDFFWQVDGGEFMLVVIHILGEVDSGVSIFVWFLNRHQLHCGVPGEERNP